MDNIIEVSHLTKTYHRYKAVNNISFTIQKGSITGFVGKNGAGKTTTIRAMMNMIKPSEGTIKICGKDSQIHAKEIRTQLGYMSSDSCFYEKIKVIDVLRFCSRISHEPIESYLELAAHFELDVHKSISELSLGNKKKLSIAQSLTKEKQVFILDEPTNGLDPYMQNRFFDLLSKYKAEGKTIFLSSHNLSDVEKYCDRALIIKDGTLAEDIDLHQYKNRQAHIVSYQTKEGIHKTFTHQGELSELMKELSTKSLKQLEIRQKSIEDEFIKYFGGDEE